MTTTAILINALFAATALALIVGLCAWAIVSSRPRQPQRPTRGRAATRPAPALRTSRRPRDLPAR